MDILIKPKKNRYIIYAIIIAIFSTVGMNISLMNTNADKLLKKFEYSSTWNNFMAVFRTSISGKNDVRLFYQLVAVGITLMFLIIFSYRFCVREIVSSAVVSIIFGFCMWFGTVFFVCACIAILSRAYADGNSDPDAGTIPGSAVLF